MISVVQVNKDAIVKCTNTFDIFDNLCPASLYTIDEWEGRIKKIVRGKNTISVNQFKFVFRECKDF